jgi:hypothetical protein
MIDLFLAILITLLTNNGVNGQWTLPSFPTPAARGDAEEVGNTIWWSFNGQPLLTDAPVDVMPPAQSQLGLAAVMYVYSTNNRPNE